MAQPGVFDELSTRITKAKRPDSGIHNSVELNADEVKTHVKAGRSSEELNDSGQESADQMDSSVSSSSGKKKQGFLKSFKKIFKKKKTSTNSKPTKKKSEETQPIQEQYRSHSQTDVLSNNPHSDNDRLKRFNTESSSGLSPKRPVKPLRHFDSPEGSAVDNADEKNSDKKGSLKDAQQYIRSSLRKLKAGKKNEKTDSDGDITAKSAEIDTSVISRNSLSANASFDDEFFSRSLAVHDKTELPSSSVPVKLGEIRPTSPQIENAVAKDRIRVAPQNRRKPSRYLTGSAPPKPARTASSFSFKDDLGLTKIDEDKDNFTSMSRHNSNVSRHDSARESSHHSSFVRSDSDCTHRSSIDSTTYTAQSSDHIPKALLNKHSFSSGDEMQKPRSLAQRSFSTNSRENIDRPKAPVKPPRSAHASSSSLNGDDNAKLSLSELRSKIFYTDDVEKVRQTNNRTTVPQQNSSLQDIKKEIRNSNENIFGNQRLSYEDKRKSFGESSIHSGDNDRNSVGDNRRSLTDRKSSDEGKRTSVTDLRQSLENISQTKRNSYGVNRISTGSSDSKRDSYGASFGLGLSNSRSSLGGSNKVLPESEQNVTKRSSSSLERRDDNSSGSKEKISSNSSPQELVFPKEEARYGMMAFALTSPRQDNVEAMQTSNMLRSKSYSGKLEKTESSSPPRKIPYHSNVNNSKSVGYINEVGSKTNPVDEKPLASPRKLRKPSPKEEGERKTENKTPSEFHRISLRKVPKLEDYMMDDGDQASEKQHDTSNTSSILDFVNNELNLDEPSPTKQSAVSPFNLSRSEETPSKTKPSDLRNKENARIEKDEDVKTSVAFKRSSLNKIDLTSMETSKDVHVVSSSSPLKTPSDVKSDQPEVKRALWKDFDEKKSGSESSEFKRHSLKKVDLPNTEDSKTSSLQMNREPELKEERDRPPRPLVKNRPTVHGTQAKKDFSFQSNDIKNRSKSLNTSDQKRLTEKASTAAASEETNSAEPTWFKLARRKQKNDETTNENVLQTSPRNSSEFTKRPISPPTKPKPKVSPRPPAVSTKPEVSPRPPPVAKKPSSIASPPSVATNRINRGQFNAKSSEHCLVCGKTAYSIERVVVDEKHVLHKDCAKCTICYRKLNIGGIFIRNDTVYCSHHK